MSELLRQELTDKKDIETYFYNFGVMTAMFHGLGSRDMHQENVMACGKKPAVVAVETFLSIQKLSIESENPIHALNYSVIGIGSFPYRLHKMGFLSALHLTQQPVINSLPLFEGKSIGIDGYEQIFLQGFSEGYDRMIKHRDEIEPLLTTHLNSVVRHVRLNTTYYYYIYRNLCMTSALSSAEKQQEALNQLKILFAQDLDDKYEAIVSYEKECLLRGDIPYYCIALDGKDLCGETVNQILLKDHFDCSPLQNMRIHLGNLSTKEKFFKEDFIFNILRHVPKDIPKDKKFPLGTKKATAADMRQMAELKTCAAIHAIYPVETENFLSRYLPLIREKSIPLAEKVGVGYGLAGLLISLTELYQKNIGRGEILDRCLTECAFTLANKEFPKNAGGDNGTDRIVSAMAKAYACTGEKLFAEVAVKALNAIPFMKKSAKKFLPHLSTPKILSISFKRTDFLVGKSFTAEQWAGLNMSAPSFGTNIFFARNAAFSSTPI